MEQRINFKTLLTKIGLLGILMTFNQCATGQKIDKTTPVQLNDPYYQKWVAGVRGGGAGFTVYFPVHTSSSNIELKTAYFQGKKVSLSFDQNTATYSGRYTDPRTLKKEIVMSSDPKEEYNNKIPEIEEKIPFDLKEEECIIAYSKNGKEGYFKLDKLPEKELKAYPMKPRQ